MQSGAHIAIVETEERKNAVCRFRFRYDVSVEEMGRYK